MEGCEDHAMVARSYLTPAVEFAGILWSGGTLHIGNQANTIRTRSILWGGRSADFRAAIM